MKVSVILPVFNKAPWLREAMDSILAQSYGGFELIAVDDASTDTSAEVLRAYLHDPRLRIITNERNQGPGLAAQRAIDAATGEYIVRMDADDVMLPGRIARQVAYMDARPEVGMSGGGAVVIGDDGAVRACPEDDAQCRADLLFGVSVLQPTSILRRSVLQAAGVRYQPHWPHVAEDWLLMIELMPRTRFGNLLEPLIRYRKGEQNISGHGGSYLARKQAAHLALGLFGIAATDREAELLMVPGGTDRCVVDKAFVRDIHVWFTRLRSHFARDARFDPVLVNRRIDAAWDRLFYRLADAGWGPAMEHVRLGGSLRPGQLYYLCRARAGRRPNAFPDER